MPCIFFLFDALKMSEAPAARDKRLSTGAHVSGSFGNFYENPDPNIKRRKWQRIFGTVQGACGPRKYRVLFDCGKVVECFSNTLHVETSTSSVPPEELQIAISQAERRVGESVTPIAAAIVAGNEAAANDAVIEEHLPGSPEEDEAENSALDDDIAENGEEQAQQERPVGAEDGEEQAQQERLVGAEDGEEQAPQESSQQERPVGVVSKAPAEDATTYARQKEAALCQIRSLCGQRVVIERNRNESLEWIVVVESQPEDEDIDIDEEIGLKKLSEVTRARYDILLAHLFLLLTFKVSIEE